VIYVDTSLWGPLEEPLYDRALALTGRPDYLVEHGGQIIPVEVKSNQSLEGPYNSHIFQLAAYCLLVERTHGVRPSYGILHYPDQTFAVDYTPDLETALLDLLAEIRTKERRTNLNRSHDSPARCNGCGYRWVCDQRLS
jgi:CRISPR-associated exonuclease Cas4